MMSATPKSDIFHNIAVGIGTIFIGGAAIYAGTVSRKIIVEITHYEKTKKETIESKKDLVSNKKSFASEVAVHNINQIILKEKSVNPKVNIKKIVEKELNELSDNPQSFSSYMASDITLSKEKIPMIVDGWNEDLEMNKSLMRYNLQYKEANYHTRDNIYRTE